jgi:methylmalonyl-CoA mutase N-terminal domain/subunit
VERGETVVVGVNRFGVGGEPPVIPAPDFSALERSQVARLADVRRTRDASRVRAVLDALVDAARPYATADGARPELMPLIIDAVRARASVGEITDALASVWGRYSPVM